MSIRRRIERMQGTLMKLTAQLEECKMMLNQEKEGAKERW